MEDTKIGMKLKEETKDVVSMCETMQTALKEQFSKGVDQIDTHEMYKAIDIFKDLCEAKKYIVEACYKTYILEAMEKAEEDEDESEVEDGDLRFYRGQRRDSRGRFMSGRRRSYEEYPYYHMDPEMYPNWNSERDMDRMDGKMYYSGRGNNSGNGRTGSSDNSSRGYDEGYSRGDSDGYRRGYEEGQRSGNQNQSRSERARRGYEEAQNSTSSTSQDGKDKRIRELTKYMDELHDEMKEMTKDMSPEERTVLKNKLGKLGTIV